MAKSVVNRIYEHERLTESQIVRMMRGDYTRFVKDGSDYTLQMFCEENILCYHILVNTWLLIAYDLGGSAAEYALTLDLLDNGVSETIISCAEYADKLVQYYHKRGRKDCPELRPSHRIETEVTMLKPKKALQILRYPKRFAPPVPKSASKLSQAATDKFCEIQVEMKAVTEALDKPHGASFNAIVTIAREIIREILGEFPGFKESTFPRFGPGVCRNLGAGNNNVYGKYEYLVAVGAYQPTHQLFYLPYRLHPDLDTERLRKKPNGKRERGNLDRPHLGGLGRYPQISRFGTVPKKVTADRGIGPEDAANMNLQLQLKDLVESRIKSSRWAQQMPFDNQEINRELARKGALYNRITTRDYSSASDTLTKRLVQMLVPDDWWRAFMRCIPVGFIVTEHDFGPRKLYSFATMGCGCTFVVETLIFFAIAAATSLYLEVKAKRLTMDEIFQGKFEISDAISAMGDDVEVPYYLHEVLLIVDKWFGFRVNGEKTFHDGRYRESCGAEWLLTDELSVEDVTSCYWPRIPFRGDWSTYAYSTFTSWSNNTVEHTNGLKKLIALQHRLYQVSPTAAKFLTDVIRCHAPCITSGPPTNEIDDLWADTDEYQAVCYYVSKIIRTDESGQKLPSVPPKYRTWNGILLPDGYCLQSRIWEFLNTDADQAQRRHMLTCGSLYDPLPYVRRLRVSLTTGSMAVPTSAVNYDLLEVLRLERALTQETQVRGLPDVNLLSQNGETVVNLATLTGLRSWQVSYGGLFGIGDVTVVTS